MTSPARPVAVVTGASAGIGAATARQLSAQGFALVLGARRVEKLEEVAATCTGPVTVLPLDVTDTASVDAFAAGAGSRVDVLVNNAGGALGLDSVETGDEEQWRWMYEANVIGLLRTTRAFLPSLVASGDGRIVTIGSIAGIETYDGGGGYTAAKHAAHAVTETLRLELLGRPVRVILIAPGMVETEFSVVRFAGDEERAAKVYEGLTPLTADDIADCITWAVTRPPHVNIDSMVVRPLAQARAQRVHRNSLPN